MSTALVDSPLVAGFLNRLASFSRLILFDKHGTGLSDRVSGAVLPTLEQRMYDLRAVMDGAGSQNAALFGASEGAQHARCSPRRTRSGRRHWFSLAATREQFRTETFPRDGYPLIRSTPTCRRCCAVVRRKVRLYTDDPMQLRSRDRYQRLLRAAATPGAAVALLRMGTDMDIRDVLPAIRVPTLVLVRGGDENLPACR